MGEGRSGDCQCSAAEVRWDGDQPVSEQFGDIYFSRAGGLEECQAIFLGGNGLPDRWLGRDAFTIGEIGFGTGLNFLATVASWDRSVRRGATLNYFAVERYPLRVDDMRRATQAWPDLDCYREELLDVYPNPNAGWHRILLRGGAVSLTLVFDEAVRALSQAVGKVDAWYLDGFAPKRNPEMWAPELFYHVARLSWEGSTFSTFTAATLVRDRLRAEGFEVCRVAGFGGKRHRLQGVLRRRGLFRSAKPWFSTESIQPMAERRVVVVGAGIAGLSVAHTLVRRGWKVEVLEQGDRYGGGGSGSPGALVMPQLDGGRNAQSRFYEAAFRFTKRWLNGLAARYSGFSFHSDGAQVFHDRFFRAGDGSRAVRPGGGRLVPDLYGESVLEASRLCPDVIWLEPQRLLEALIADADLAVRYRTRVSAIQSFEGGLRLLGTKGETVTSAPWVLLAPGHECPSLPHDFVPPVKAVAGQVTVVSSDRELKIDKPLIYDGYAVPLAPARLLLGATYRHTPTGALLLHGDDLKNTTAFLRTMSAAAPHLECETSWAAHRAVTYDRLPLVGPVPDARHFLERYGDLAHGRPADRYPLAEWVPGLFLSMGHGSRGFTGAPFAAQCIADWLDSGVLPVPEAVATSMSPARDIVRRLKRTNPK